MNYYAHTKDQDPSQWQRVEDHLKNTAALARSLGCGTGAEDFAFVAAMLHDLGKYSEDFQRKLNGAKIQVDHSTAGAQELRSVYNQNPVQSAMATLLEYCIVGHHSGLPDFGSSIDLENDGTLQARLKKQIRDYSAYRQEIDWTQLSLPAKLPIRPVRGFPGFSISFFTRMIYSILVDADFQETETFINGAKPRGNYETISELCEKFNQFLKAFDLPQGEINKERTRTLKACIQKAKQGPGFYTLTVPTGGGKTFSSMAFALNHAVGQKNKMQRIIYVIPYTSIIEQNAAEFKRSLGEGPVLEHHSNFDWDGKNGRRAAEFYDDRTNDALEKLKLAAENWDIPIVVTTNVQFFESLFANRSSRCRKLHNVAHSVLIFDEAQMLPRDYLKPSMLAVNELVQNYGCTAVFCTATQPCIEKFLPDGTHIEEITPDPQGLYEFYRRVEVKNLGTLKDEVLAERINAQPQALCIVNTRKHARGLFEMVEDEGRFHLSTLMCPAHRKGTVAKIKQRLQDKQPCRVVSTQIMEAGIDVDFPVGYRSISGLDSIIQAAGRVNREGRAARGTLFVFEPDSEFVKRTPAYIAQGADVARKILRDFEDPVSLQAIQAYFSEMYGLHDEKAFDSKHILEYFDKGVREMNFDFKSAAENFKLIENAVVPVIIPYDDQARKWIELLGRSPFPRTFLRKLQPYTVSIYEQEFEALQSSAMVDIYCDAYAVLNENGSYDSQVGLMIPENKTGSAIFFDG